MLTTLLVLVLAGPVQAPAQPAQGVPQKAVPVEDAEKRHMRLIAEFHAAVPDKAGRITITIPIDRIWVFGQHTVIEEHNNYTGEQYQRNQELFNRVAIRIAPSVAERIKKIVGTTNLETHFKGRTVTASGTRSTVFFTGFPAQFFYSVTVDRIEDIEVLPIAADAAKK